MARVCRSKADPLNRLSPIHNHPFFKYGDFELQFAVVAIRELPFRVFVRHMLPLITERQ